MHMCWYKSQESCVKTEDKLSFSGNLCRGMEWLTTLCKSRNNVILHSMINRQEKYV